MAGTPRKRARKSAPPSEPAPPRRPGRPCAVRPEDTPATKDRICERITGGESVRSICDDPDMPCRSTVLQWLCDDAEFQAKCARARELQADVIFDDLSDLEEKVSLGTLAPDAARVVIGSKQWRAGRLAPKKYGDKVAVEQTGANGGPIQHWVGGPGAMTIGEWEQQCIAADEAKKLPAPDPNAEG